MKLVWASSCEQLQAADRQPTELRQLLQAADAAETPPTAADQHDLDGKHRADEAGGGGD